MPSPMANKRRRLSKDGKASPVDGATTALTANSPTRKPSMMRNYMTPTKASVAKSYPHLAKPLTPSRQQRQEQQQPSPTRRHRQSSSPLKQPPRRSIPPADTQTTQIVGARSFLDIANAPEDDHDVAVGEKEPVQEPTGMATGVGATAAVKENRTSLVETHLSNEEEIERLRGALMKRIRLLRAECDDLDGQLEQARHTRQTAMDVQDEAVQTNLPATIQSLLQSNDTSLSRQPTTPETLKQSLPTAAPKNLKNPLPLLRFIHRLTFYSTTSHLAPVDIHVLRQYELKGRTMERELHFTITMSVNESQERITSLQIQTSPWANLELSPFLQRVATTFNAQMALTALSTYGKISSHRALVFARLARDLVDLLSPAHSSTMQIVSRKGKARASDASLPIYRVKKLWLGERSISFHRGAVGIVIIWDIVIDDLGFAGSKLSIASSLPQHWWDSDERSVLSGLEGTFDSLVRRFGVERAVKTLVGVIYEDE